MAINSVNNLETTDKADASKPPAKRWVYVIPVAVIMYMLAYLDRTNSGGIPSTKSTVRQLKWSRSAPVIGEMSTDDRGRQHIHRELALARSLSGNQLAMRMSTEGHTPPSKKPRTNRAV